ncbi:MAG: hypothetical protein ABIV43_03600 [Candidatus Saccharimonadales bacterium]
METIPKSPQEMAAQMLDVYPYYSDYAMPEGEAERLGEQAKGLKVEVEGLRPYMLPDDELAPKLAEVRQRATESGVWRADKGEGADERLAYAVEQNKGYGYTEEEATEGAVKELKRNGYLDAIRDKRKEQERLFKDPISAYISSHEVEAETERAELDKLLERTVDMTTLNEVEIARLSHDFPSGNFVYHGTGTEQLVKILDTGVLANAKALYEREDATAKAEGREAGIVRRNSGFEGVSWSMNGIDALPGDRFHMAGFVAAPEAILSDTMQLAVPSRPAPNEVLQISADVDAREFYDAKTQFELYRNPGMFGETNSVFDNLFSVSMWNKEENRQFRDEPMLYQAKRGLLAQPKYQDQLRELYSVDESGKIRLDPDLSQQIDNEIPVAAVWLQAAIDTGRLKDTQFADKELPVIIDELNGENIETLIGDSRKDWEQHATVLDEAEKVAGNVEVSVENMYFVAPRKDAEAWLNVMVRSQHKPAGILLYDDKKVRLENFASLHRGDHTELTAELQAAIKPENEGYIYYADVLGTEFSDDMRTGHKHQVIAEKHLANRGAIKKVDGKLMIERIQ